MSIMNSFKHHFPSWNSLCKSQLQSAHQEYCRSGSHLTLFNLHSSLSKKALSMDSVSTKQLAVRSYTSRKSEHWLALKHSSSFHTQGKEFSCYWRSPLQLTIQLLRNSCIMSSHSFELQWRKCRQEGSFDKNCLGSGLHIEWADLLYLIRRLISKGSSMSRLVMLL